MAVQHSANNEQHFEQTTFPDRDEYFELNPTNLTEDELEYELRLRNISHTANATTRDKTRVITEWLREEKAGRKETPEVPLLSFNVEVTGIRAKLETISFSLNNESDVTDYDLQILGSRIAFLQRRISRLENATDEVNENIVQDINNQFKKILIDFSVKRNNNPPAITRMSISAAPFIPISEQPITSSIISTAPMIMTNSIRSTATPISTTSITVTRESLESITAWSMGQPHYTSSWIGNRSAQMPMPPIINNQIPQFNANIAPPIRQVTFENNIPNTFPINYQSAMPTFPAMHPPPLQRDLFLNSASSNQQRFKPIPTHQWKLTFSGEEKKTSPTDLSVHEFVFQVNVMKQSQNIADNEMLGQISMLLTHGARIWYLSNYGKFPTWTDFINALQQRFRPNFSLIDALTELSTRKQKRYETPISFMNSMVMTLRTMPINFTEQQQVEMIQKNLLPEIQLSVAPWQPKTLGHLEHLLALMNINIPPETHTNNIHKRIVVRKQVNAVEKNENETESDSEIELTKEEICAILQNRKQKSNDKRTETKNGNKYNINNIRPEVTCHNCHEKGHIFKDCSKPRKRIFCYKCGKDEVKTFECPDCSKNSAACLTQEVEQLPETDNQ